MAQSQILFYMHRRLMVSDHGAQYEENPSSHHGGMLEDGLTDGQLDRLTNWTISYIPLFHLGRAGNKKVNL